MDSSPRHVLSPDDPHLEIVSPAGQIGGCNDPVGFGTRYDSRAQRLKMVLVPVSSLPLLPSDIWKLRLEGRFLPFLAFPFHVGAVS